VSAQTPPSANGYVGSNVCRTCHPDVWSTFYKNPHYASLANAPQPKEGKAPGAAGFAGAGEDVAGFSGVAFVSD